MPNITKNNVEPQKSALKLIRGTLLSSYVFSNFLVFINLFSNNTTVAIKSFSLEVQNDHSGRFFLFL